MPPRRNATDRIVELRAIAGAKNASQLWGLRCEIREKLIAYLQEEHPDALPVARAELRDSRDRDPANLGGTGST